MAAPAPWRASWAEPAGQMPLVRGCLRLQGGDEQQESAIQGRPEGASVTSASITSAPISCTGPAAALHHSTVVITTSQLLEVLSYLVHQFWGVGLEEPL